MFVCKISPQPEKKPANDPAVAAEPPAAQADPWSDWRPPWTGGDTAARRLLAESEAFRAARRRIVDARLWEAMRAKEQDAALSIAAAFELLGRGLGYARTDFSRLSSSGGGRSAAQVTEAQSRLIESYMDWARECTRRKLSHAMILDILCFGQSCRAVDRDRRLRNGAAKENLLRGLALYGEMRRWT